MRRPRWFLLLVGVAVMTGCGSSGDTASVTERTPPPAAKAEPAVDLNILIGSDGSAESSTGPPVERETQRVTFRNRTKLPATLSASSSSGLETTVVGAGRTGRLQWPREDTGPDRLRWDVQFRTSGGSSSANDQSGSVPFG